MFIDIIDGYGRKIELDKCIKSAAFVIISSMKPFIFYFQKYLILFIFKHITNLKKKNCFYTSFRNLDKNEKNLRNESKIVFPANAVLLKQVFFIVLEFRRKNETYPRVFKNF